LFVVGKVLDPASAGSLRGAATAMGPVNMLLAFVTLGLAPALVRRSRGNDLRFCASAGALLAVAALLWGAVLLFLPTSWGVSAFGQSWSGIRSVLPWTLSEYVCLCVAAAATLGLKVRAGTRALVRQRLVSSGVMVVAGSAWAFTFQSTRGVAAMLALSAAVLAGLAWTQLLRSVPPGRLA